MPRYRLAAGATGVTLRTEPDAPHAALSAYVRGAFVTGSLTAGTQLLEVEHPAAKVAALALYGGAILLAWHTGWDMRTNKLADDLAREWIERNMAGAMQTVTPDATPRTQPKEPLALTHAYNELIQLCQDSIRVVGEDSNRIPSSPRIEWRPERRQKAVALIDALIDKGNRGTFLKQGTLRDLDEALRARRIPLTLPAAVPGAE